MSHISEHTLNKLLDVWVSGWLLHRSLRLVLMELFGYFKASSWAPAQKESVNQRQEDVAKSPISSAGKKM